MTKAKKPLMSEAEKIATIQEGGKIAREGLRQIGHVADRVVQASITSPYLSVTMVALLSAMMVRGKLIPAETSMIVTGTGLALLGANTVTESVPILSGLTSGAHIDNTYDSHPVSPWADNSAHSDALDRYLVTLEDSE